MEDDSSSLEPPVLGHPLASLRDDCLRALGLLSRIPVGGAHLSPDSALNARATRAFPVAGFVIGLVLWLFWCFFFIFFGSGMITAALVVVVSLFVTGALHEDGLGDTADSLGVAREDRRRVLEDSHIGVYGVCAIVMVLLVRVAVLSTAGTVLVALVFLMLSEIFSRAAMVYVLWRSDASSASKLAGSWGGASEEAMVFAMSVSFVFGVIVCFVGFAPLSGWFFGVVFALVGMLFLPRVLGEGGVAGGRLILGGDGCGAVQQVVLVLTLLGLKVGGL
ncbi:MAG: adenosylcobinamide-GDP ribazoletransferase [Alphaproteobacteria bacterium]